MTTDNQQTKQKQKSEETAVEKREPTVAERFVEKVRTEFAGSVGHGAEFTDHEKQLASNLYMKIDSQLKALEADRQKKGKDKPPITWNNVNMQQLAQDAVHRVRLGLDALIDNHIHPLPYLNGKTGKYDLDLQIGFAGLDYYKRQVSEDDIVDVTYELIHENDEFTVVKKDMDNEKDHYKFKINDVFNRGEVIGGFGYIQYENEAKNKVVTVDKEEFDKAKKAAPTSKVWNEWPEKMQYKTLVRRVTKEISEDPKKVNPSYHYVEAQDSMFRDDNEVKIDQPKAEDREEIDFDDSAMVEAGAPAEGTKEDSEPEPKPNGTPDGPNATDKEAFDELLAEVNEVGRGVYGTKWFTKSKEFLPDGAEYLTDLDIDQLREVKAEVEAKAKAEA